MNCKTSIKAIGKRECNPSLNHVNQIDKIKVFQDYSCYDELDNYLGKLINDKIINGDRIIHLIV